MGQGGRRTVLLGLFLDFVEKADKPLVYHIPIICRILAIIQPQNNFTSK